MLDEFLILSVVFDAIETYRRSLIRLKARTVELDRRMYDALVHVQSLDDFSQIVKWSVIVFALGASSSSFTILPNQLTSKNGVRLLGEPRYLL